MLLRHVHEARKTFDLVSRYRAAVCAARQVIENQTCALGRMASVFMPANEDALVACGERPGLRIVRPANLEVIDKRIAACRFLLDRLFLLGRVGLGGILFL